MNLNVCKSTIERPGFKHRWKQLDVNPFTFFVKRLQAKFWSILMDQHQRCWVQKKYEIDEWWLCVKSFKESVPLEKSSSLLRKCWKIGTKQKPTNEKIECGIILYCLLIVGFISKGISAMSWLYRGRQDQPSFYFSTLQERSSWAGEMHGGQ